jgi:quercetin dioxygenase-like cupin family protein
MYGTISSAGPPTEWGGRPVLKATVKGWQANMDPKNMITIDTNAAPWQDRFNEKTGRMLYRKLLLQDPDTGMEIFVLRYPAGVTIPWHTHPCAHGMYVLEGTLVTHAGSFGPGSFVWFPEGMEMHHGATAENDVTMLFITNKPMAINYLSGR